MRTTLVIAAAMLLQAPGASLLSGAHFQSMRQVHTMAAPNQVACAILPSNIFHEAAPALRDLRLTEDGQEIPFAQEESYDQHSLASGITSPEDRSFFDVVAQKQTSATGDLQTAQFHLLARIPIERISLSKPAGQDLPIRVTARISTAPQWVESVNGVIHAGESAFPVTLGANLQQDADVQITLQSPAPAQVRLEMRRRWICFEPMKTASDLRLFYGDSSLPAANYRFASMLTMPEHPAAATIGPRQDDPPPAPVPDPTRSRRRTLLITLGAVIVFLPLIAMALVTPKLRKR